MLLQTIIAAIGKQLAKVICSICDMAKSFFQFKKASIQNKIEEREQKRKEQYEKQVDEVTNNGTIEDLLNLRK